MTRVEVKPELLIWARERAGRDQDSLIKKFPKLRNWEEGERMPTLRQLEDFARTVHVPFGYLFLPTPPVENLPVPDYRTIANEEVGRPSPDLLDTIHQCQHRQEWYREYAITAGEGALDFVGSVRVGAGVEETAELMRTRLGFDVQGRKKESRNWEESLRRFIGLAEDAGVLVMVSGIVGSNTHRKLNPREFRGFALADSHAPLVFINGADTKAAQIFTLAHELVHIWAGQSALSDATMTDVPQKELEQWCNRVSAEFLVPMAQLRKDYNASAELDSETQRLARDYRVSTLVILRRIHDMGIIDGQEFWKRFHAELARLKKLAEEKGDSSGGGDFYNTLGIRASRRFARAVIATTLEGRGSFTRAFRLLGVTQTSHFNEFARRLGIGA
ncbi:ImmA/IrrE family metallo-endopeptidase [bacterium]|nr:ImmA/IrrE family metallo-endopeptidase [bacterium]